MTGPEIVAFATLVSEHYTPGEFATLLQTIDRKFDDYVAQMATFNDQIQQAVARANSSAWTTQLVVAVIHNRPETPKPQAVLKLCPAWDPASVRR